MHPRFELPPVPEQTKDQQQKRAPTCHFCGEVGHKASYCQKMPPEVSDLQSPAIVLYYIQRLHPNIYRFCEQLQFQQREASMRQEEAKYRSYMNKSMEGDGSEQQQQPPPPPRNPPRPLEEITCYKCGTKGHYANKCPKGHLAFLSSNHHLVNKQKEAQQNLMQKSP